MTSLYSGSGAYCYANSLHMCLRAAGFDLVPEPGFLECLTTMPFGAGYIRLEQGALPLLSPVTVDPDTGLTRALAALGWTCREGKGGDEAEALARLREGLTHGPVVLGPLDMGYLSYRPDCAHGPGADHHIAVLALEDDHALVHDPDGYPYAVLPLADLLTSWQADSIAWKRGAYRMRYAFRQERQRSREDMIARTLPLIRENLLADPGGPVEYGGGRCACWPPTCAARCRRGCTAASSISSCPSRRGATSTAPTSSRKRASPRPRPSWTVRPASAARRRHWRSRNVTLKWRNASTGWQSAT